MTWKIIACFLIYHLIQKTWKRYFTSVIIIFPVSSKFQWVYILSPITATKLVWKRCYGLPPFCFERGKDFSLIFMYPKLSTQLTMKYCNTIPPVTWLGHIFCPQETNWISTRYRSNSNSLLYGIPINKDIKILITITLTLFLIKLHK